MLFRHLLFVCSGNLCRSPVAEALFRTRLASAGREIAVASAGLIALPGESADETICLAAARRGLDLSGHRSRPLDPALLRWADLVMVMEDEQRRLLRSLVPEATGKVVLLGRWTEGEIPDPFGMGPDAAEAACDRIADAAEAWLARL